MKQIKEAALLYSGGNDSTLVAAMLAGKYETVHLITCITQYMLKPDSMTERVALLQRKFPQVDFIHRIISAENILKKTWAANRLSGVLQYGLYHTNPCAVCQFSIHTRGLLYCLENNIARIYDGSNVMMSFSPSQNYYVKELLAQYYLSFGVEHFSPIYWYNNYDAFRIKAQREFSDDALIKKNLQRNKNSDTELAGLGILQQAYKVNVREHYLVQPKCYHHIYTTYLLLYYMLPFKGYAKLQAIMLRRYRGLIRFWSALITEELTRGHGFAKILPEKTPVPAVVEVE